MSVRMTQARDVTVLHLAGAYYGGEETELLRKTIDAQIAAGNLRLVLDLSECTSMNSNALGMLIEARRACHTAGGDLRLCSAEKRVKTVLRVSRLASFFEVHDCPEHAVEAFREASAG